MDGFLSAERLLLRVWCLMTYTEESFNLIAAGDRLMAAALGAKDIAQRLTLLVEAKRCFSSAGMESTVSMINRWIYNGSQLTQHVV